MKDNSRGIAIATGRRTNNALDDDSIIIAQTGRLMMSSGDNRYLEVWRF